MAERGGEETEPFIPKQSCYIQITNTQTGSYGSVSIVSPDQTPDHSVHHHTQVYKRRWWIVIAFSLCAMAQSAQWNIWGPISDAVQIVYDWDDSVVTLFPAISNGAFILFGFVFMYGVELHGKPLLLVISSDFNLCHGEHSRAQLVYIFLGLRFGTVVVSCLIMLTMALWNLAVALEMNWSVYSSFCY